jgi:hypothetical protein
MTEEEKKALELEEAEKKRLADEDIKQKAIDDLKEKLDKAVDPEEHAKLKADYKKLMDDYVNKRPVIEKQKKQTRPVAEIALELKNIQSGDISNREYIKKSLEYREAHIKEFGTDPWTNFSPEGSEKATKDTNRIAESLQILVDENDSPVDFRIKMNSVLKDDQGLLRKLNKRKK